MNVLRAAIISPCGLYRYRLDRIVERDNPRTLAVCMLNPSKADAEQDDPTITRLMSRTTSLGFGRLIVVNAFALRATDPQKLYEATFTGKDPIGSDNDAEIQIAASDCEMFLCGWGKHCDHVKPGRSLEIFDVLRTTGRVPYALDTNADGSPVHPLYQTYAKNPRPLHEDPFA